MTTRIDITGLDRGRGDCRGESCQAEISEYEAAALALDIVEVRTNRVIWRGWAQHALGDVLEDRDTMEKRIWTA